jgi:hypothetical protein
VRIRNCDRNIADAVASAIASHRNCGVILTHVYGHIVTTSNNFGDFCSNFLPKNKIYELQIHNCYRIRDRNLKPWEMVHFIN